MCDRVPTGGAAAPARHRAVPVSRRLAMLLCLFTTAASAGRPPLSVPGRDDVVLERLPSGYAQLEGAATRALPPAATVGLAQQLLSTAARTGDARLAARADALLARVPSRGAPAVLVARAFSAQHRHDFAGALRLLDATLDREPRNGDALLMRAQVQLVQGRLDRARADCGALVLGIDADAGLLCLAALSLRTGSYAQAAQLADRWLATAGGDRQARRYGLVMRGEIASRAGEADADHWFTQALALDPADVRTLAAFARHLQAHGRQQDVLALLATAPSTDGLQLRRALAAHAVHAVDARKLADAQGRRYALAHEVGSQPELRDEAEYRLVLRGDAQGALRLAQRNFRDQRDFEDVDLLLRAARAARRSDITTAVAAWARTQHLPIAPERHP